MCMLQYTTVLSRHYNMKVEVRVLSSHVNRERKRDSHKKWCFPRHWQKVTGRRARELEEGNVYLCFCLAYFMTAVGETKTLPNEILAENWHERPGIRPWNAAALLTNNQRRLSWLLTNTEINLIGCRQQDPGTGRTRAKTEVFQDALLGKLATTLRQCFQYCLLSCVCVCVYTNSHTLTTLRRLVYSAVTISDTTFLGIINANILLHYVVKHLCHNT